MEEQEKYGRHDAGEPRRQDADERPKDNAGNPVGEPEESQPCESETSQECCAGNTPESLPPIPEACKPEAPEIPEEIVTESKWAKTFGMDYNPDQAMRNLNAVPDEAPAAQNCGQPNPDSFGQQPRQGSFGPQPAQQPGPQSPQGWTPQQFQYGPSQPGQPIPGQQRPTMPPTFLLWSILATICCCLPAGVVAILFSSQVSTKYYARDYEGARKASERAEIWIIAAIVLGVVFNMLYLPLSIASMPLQG